MSKRILVVDDDAMCLRMCELVLNKDYEVIKADSGEACLTLLEKETFELVLLDVEMPGFDGFETLEALRKTERGAFVKVAFLSADEDEDTRERAKSLGAVGFVKKPFLPEDLKKFVAAQTS